jgi:PAS domain S-box-containing protein
MDMRHSVQLDKEARQHHRQGPSRNRYVALVLIVFLGLALSAILFRLATHQEQIHQQADFALKSKDLANNIKQVLEHSMYEIDAMSSFYAASDSVERGEFHKYVHHLLFYDPALQTLAWIPRVTDSQRATYEGKARQEGHPHFQITEKNAQGSLVRAGRRAEYFPMYFLEPYEGNEPALGFDLTSEPARLEALTRARDTGEKTATSRIVLVQEKHDQYGFLNFTPLYRHGAPLNTIQQRRRHLQGFVLGVYRIGDLVEKALSHLTPSGIDIHLFDDSASADNRFLYLHDSQLRKEYHPPTLDEAQLKSGVHYAETINIAGRDWLLLFTPTPGSLTEGTSALPWSVLAFGVLCTGFLAGYLWLAFSRIDTSRLYTAQLLRAKEGLEHEIIERKLTDISLRAIKEQLSSLFNNSPVSLWLEDFTDVKTFLDGLREKGHADLRTYLAEHQDAIAHAASLLKIVDVNKATLELYGAKSKEDLLAGLEKTFTAESYRAFSEGLIAIAEGNTKFEIETVTKTLNDEKLNVVIKWSLIPMAGQQASSMVVSVLDITERKKAGDALQLREAQLIESQRIAHIGSWERDIATNRVTWSDELYRIVGYDPHTTKASYQLLLDRIHPDDRERFMKAGKEAVYENKPYRIDFRILRKDGTEAVIHSRGEVFHNEDGTPVLFRGTVQDITERKQTEEKAASLARILETTLNEIYIVEAETLRFLFVNQGARQNLGYSVEELRLMTPLHINPEYTAETFRDLIEPLRSDKQKMVQFTTLHRRKDNSVYPVEVHLQRSVFEHIPVYVASILDITERKKLESQLLQAHKMEAVGQLAGGIAHDFNNILTAIIGYATIMQMKMMKDDPLTKNLDSILASAQRAATLTQNLLAFSRKQVMQLQPVDMNKIVKNVYNLLSRIIGEDVELKTTLAPGEVIIQADRGQIEQILMNLATNARDAMPAGGTLSIETSRAAVDTEVIGIHGPVPSGIYALLSISDTGEGLDETTKKRMFDPFFTTKEVNKGTGLGLSIIYGIVKQHEGYISVDSVLGKGTTFRIYLPLCRQANKENRSEELPASKGGTETILYAEDDATIRDVLEEVLTTAGYTVIAAHDGEDAIHKFIENKDNIHLLVLDVIMPKKSGKEAYDAIKQMRSNIKVLFISGYTADMIQKRGVMEDGVNFLYKPVSPNDFLQKVRDVLR